MNYLLNTSFKLKIKNMKKAIYLFALVFTTTLFAQSKQETETWIKSFMSTYSNGNITFQSGIMTFDNPYDPMGFHTRTFVKIEDLAGIKISEGTRGHTAVYLSCYNGNCVTDGLKSRDAANFDTFESNKFTMQFSSVLPPDLQSRIEKAFTHLIKIYGGHIADNTF